jgi:hypothetical protein
MSTLTIRLPATKHQRLKDFARARGVSLNKLVEEWATVALAQLDAENHYGLPTFPLTPSLAEPAVFS